MSNKKRVIALGFFDGVHIGHAALLEMAKKRAAALGAQPTVLSFDVHPDNLVRGVEVPLITGIDGRTDIIRRLFGIESVVYIHFNETMMRMPWREFAQSLIEELNVCHFVVGYDFRFGYRGEGTAKKLAEYCASLGLGCDTIPAVKLEGETVSSTLIRSMLLSGDVERANRFLGHPLSLIDTVGHGFHLGASLGAPTINMRFQPGVLVPRHGVYAAKVFPNGEEGYPAVTNVGVRPTVSGENTVSVESFILNYSGDLYDRSVRVEFYKFLRDERKFPDLDSLKRQISEDAKNAGDYFAAL